jgi:hypothetical protein
MGHHKRRVSGLLDQGMPQTPTILGRCDAMRSASVCGPDGRFGATPTNERSMTVNIAINVSGGHILDGKGRPCAPDVTQHPIHRVIILDHPWGAVLAPLTSVRRGRLACRHSIISRTFPHPPAHHLRRLFASREPVSRYPVLVFAQYVPPNAIPGLDVGIHHKTSLALIAKAWSIVLICLGMALHESYSVAPMC